MFPPCPRLPAAVATLVVTVAVTACHSEPLRPGGPSLADGVTRAESLAILGPSGVAVATALVATDENACGLRWSAPDRVLWCGSRVPAVLPRVPWLEHSGRAVEPGEIEQRVPIRIAFADTTVWEVALTGTGAVKCSGRLGRMVGFRNGVVVARVENTLIDPGDCGSDDLTYGVSGRLPADVRIDSLVIEGVDPWTFTVLGACCGRARLRYDLRFTVACHDTVRTLRAEYPVYGATPQPACAAFATGGGSTHFAWWELNGSWSTGNPHRTWGLIGQGLLRGLEDTRANYARGGILLTSGYRCPHGNAGLAGAARNSLHVHGRAADMYSADYGGRNWTSTEFDRLRLAASETVPAPVQLFQWSTYADHHLHAAW
jgi:hypothetical protein